MVSPVCEAAGIGPQSQNQFAARTRFPGTASNHVLRDTTRRSQVVAASCPLVIGTTASPQPGPTAPATVV